MDCIYLLKITILNKINTHKKILFIFIKQGFIPIKLLQLQCLFVCSIIHLIDMLNLSILNKSLNFEQKSLNIRELKKKQVFEILFE